MDCDTQAGDSQAQKKYNFNIATVKPLMAIDSPVRNGLVTDWDMMEELWDHCLARHLHMQRGDLAEHPVLVAEKPYNPQEARRKTMEFLFEAYSAPAAFLSKDAVLSCYACGKTSGLVVDMGASGTVLSPVQDGWLESKGLIRSPLGGRAADAHISTIFSKIDMTPAFRLQKRVNMDTNELKVQIRQDLGEVHPSYDAYMRMEVMKDMKESITKMAETPPDVTDPRWVNLPLVPYELPDGTIVDVGVQRFLTSELYVFPESVRLDHPLLQGLYKRSTGSGEAGAAGAGSSSNSSSSGSGSSGSGSSSGDSASKRGNELIAAAEARYAAAVKESVGLASIPKLICDSIVRSDSEMQTMLLANMVLSGGSACVEGLSDRLKAEVDIILYSAGAAPGYRSRMMTVAPQERAICAWLGGSILGSLGSFHELWISKKEYEEYGPRIVDRKCP